ncbi:MAG TPA: Mur ligase family protein, partial [Solirubrobacteraceae bacterium]|nr:Mur ligase family protein [Solirubrobacteraceae bacterium]
NTEIGVPLEILETGAGTEVLVLELAMRGVGQIGELAEISEPDVGVIVNVGPVHLELLGSLEAIAAAKSELTDALAPGATAVVPADEPLLAPHRRADLTTVTFGPGGDVTLARDAGDRVEVDAGGERIALEVAFHQSHQKRNLLAAVAAARAVGVTPAGRVDARFSAGRGERIELARDVVVINDCYNANPMSMRAALDELAAQPVAGRRIAVLGDMLELGPEEARFHQEIGRHAADRDVDVLVAVGPLAAAMVAPFGASASAVPDADAAAALVAGLVRPGDTVLVKASRGVGLEVVAEALQGSVV